MELTGKLKEMVEQDKTREEVKNLIAQAGIELTDEELDSVAGGAEGSQEYWQEKYEKTKTDIDVIDRRVEQGK